MRRYYWRFYAVAGHKGNLRPGTVRERNRGGSAYPFSGEGALASYRDAQFGSLGETVTLNTVMDAAAQSGNQPFNIYTYSGGFQELANIWTLLPSNVQQNANIISIEPGRVPFGADLPNATVFQGNSLGNSVLTALGPSGTTINLCGHDAKYMFGIFQLDGFLGPNGNGLQQVPQPCPNRKVFTRQTPLGASLEAKDYQGIQICYVMMARMAFGDGQWKRPGSE